MGCGPGRSRGAQGRDGPCINWILRLARYSSRAGIALPPEQLREAVFAAEPLQSDADLLLGRVVLPVGPPDVLHNLLGRRGPRLGFLAHLRFSF